MSLPFFPNFLEMEFFWFVFQRRAFVGSRGSGVFTVQELGLGLVAVVVGIGSVFVVFLTGCFFGASGVS